MARPFGQVGGDAIYRRKLDHFAKARFCPGAQRAEWQAEIAGDLLKFLVQMLIMHDASTSRLPEASVYLSWSIGNSPLAR